MRWNSFSRRQKRLQQGPSDGESTRGGVQSPESIGGRAAHDATRIPGSCRPAGRAGSRGGIANVEITGLDPGKLADHLWQRHHILVTPIVHPEFRGLRVTPSVYTTLAEIDQFSEVMEEIAEKGIPV